MRNIHCLEIIQYNTIILFSVNLSGNKVLVEIQTQLKYTFSLHAIKSVKNTLYSAGRPEGAQLLFYFAPLPPPLTHTHTHGPPRIVKISKNWDLTTIYEKDERISHFRSFQQLPSLTVYISHNLRFNRFFDGILPTENWFVAVWFVMVSHLCRQTLLEGFLTNEECREMQ